MKEPAGRVAYMKEQWKMIKKQEEECSDLEMVIGMRVNLEMKA